MTNNSTQQEPRRRGRPATGRDPQRQFRMSDAEFAEVKAACEAAGVTLSEVVRKKLLSWARSTNRKSKTTK